MGSAYSTKAELQTAANWPFLGAGRRASGCFPSGLRCRGLRLLKLSFTVLFRSLPLLSLFSSPFFYPLHLRQHFPPLAVVAFRLLAVSDLLGSRCRLRAFVRRASGRWGAGAGRRRAGSGAGAPIPGHCAVCANCTIYLLHIWLLLRLSAVLF